MGLTDGRKAAKNLVHSRKQGKKELIVKETKKKKEGDKFSYGCVIYFSATLTPYARQAKLLLGVNLDLGSISAAHSKNQVFFPINTSKTTRRDVTVCKTLCR